MKEESKELYNYTKDHFIKDLKRISPDCVAPLIATRQVVKRAIEQYTKDYASIGDELFSNEDFKAVSDKLYEDIKNNELD